MTDKPNLLIILSDQHGPMWSGPYGHSIVRTPHMDRLAADGVVFENAYCNSPICVPSRMSFMTGRYVSNTGVWDNGVPLPSDMVTWAHGARAAGYDVALAGKMHFRGLDHLHGFRTQLAHDINGANLPSIPDWSQPLPVRDSASPSIRAEAGHSKEIAADDAVAEAALTYLRDPARQSQPWALVAGFVAPHPPFIAPQQYLDMYPPDDMDLPHVPADHLENQHPAYRRLRRWRGLDGLPGDNIRRARAAYYALVTYLDDKIGQLLAALDETGQRDNTVIVYLSDHGEMLGEHGLWYKCNFYEESVRVPLIVAGPGIGPGQRRAEVVSTVDVTATLLDLMGMPTAHAPDGDSLLPLLRGESMTWKDEAFSEFYANGSTRPWAMLRQGRYKLVYSLHEVPELYDLADDPGELRNLAADEDYQPVLRALAADLLRRWNPAALDERIRASQRDRILIYDDLFGYLRE